MPKPLSRILGIPAAQTSTTPTPPGAKSKSGLPSRRIGDHDLDSGLSNISTVLKLSDEVQSGPHCQPLLGSQNTARRGTGLSAVASESMIERSMAPLTSQHLRRLAEIAEKDRDGLFGRNPHLSVYRDRILLTALCQGAALHFVDGTNGVKDLDVYTFYAADPSVGYPYRRRGVVDFGDSESGRHPNDHEFRGRRVDLLGRTLKVPMSSDPVAAVQGYLRARATTTAKELAKKAVVVIDPGDCFGQVIWPVP